jgi:hypothetical protein
MEQQMDYQVLVYIHLLLLVFWLGTDLGVFAAARMSQQGALATETRVKLMELGMLLDRLPRSALILITPTGAQLAVMSGVLDISVIWLQILWLFSAFWLGILWLGFLNQGKPIEEKAMRLNLVFNGVMAILLCGYGVTLYSDLAVPFWMATKVLLIGLVFVSGVLLDVLFRPAIVAFADIVMNGGSDERNEKYSAAINPVYFAVIAIYALVLLAAFMGTVKPS